MTCRLWVLSILLFSGVFTAQMQKNIFKNSTYNVGGILSHTESVTHFWSTIEDLNQQGKPIKLKNVTMLMDSNPIRTALDVCNILIKESVYSVIVSHPLNGDLSPAAVSYTSGFYHIPVIGISSRDSAFSDKNIHVSFLRTVPPYSHQADVWVELLKTFQYNQILFIHSSDTDGRALLGRFQNHAQNHEDEKDVKVETVIEFEPGLNSFVKHLDDMRSAAARVFLVYANKVDAQTIFHDAFYFNMTQEGYIWIVTEQALSAEGVPVGTIGLRLNASIENSHITDSLRVLANALVDYRNITNSTATEPPQNCDNTGSTWESGKYLFEAIKSQVLPDGLTGKVAFDDNGDRINAEYEIVNIQENHATTPISKRSVVVGQFIYNKPATRTGGALDPDSTEDKTNSAMKLTIDQSKIVWPGNSRIKPLGYMIPTKLKVLTIEEKPFVYTRKVDNEKECNVTSDEFYCPIDTKNVSAMEKYCCRGYCMSLLDSMSKKCNFTFNLYLSPDGEFGSIRYNDITRKKEWSGMIGQLMTDLEGADMIVAPLTINPERAQVIEFSKPFKYQGITILEKKQPKYSTLVSFLQPFRDTLWILVMVSVHVVALVLYLLDRFSPFGRYKMGAGVVSGNPDNTEEDALNLSSAIWFAWGVLLNSGIGEGTPRSFSARVLGMVWAGFAMIIVASYTANLAAFLVLDRPQTSLTGINDARLRNPMENFTYATVKGSSVDMYFRRQVELSNMYRTMEGNNYHSADEAIDSVKNGKLKAFIWDSSRLEYEAAQDCDLVTAGELFGRSGYGIGLKKQSPWADRVTLAILEFHESGFMEELDNTWILMKDDEKCDTDDMAPATLGLKNMAGVFILVAAGIVGGIALIIIEIVYKKHQIRKQKKMEVARRAADKWRGAVEKRRLLRSSLILQRRMKENGVNDPTISCISVEDPLGAVSTVARIPSTSSVASGGVISGLGGGISSIPASVNIPGLPTMLPPPPAPPSSIPPTSMPPELPPAPAPPAIRWGNDLRQRHNQLIEDRLPPPPPPPAGVDTARLAASYKNLFGPDPPDLVA